MNEHRNKREKHQSAISSNNWTDLSPILRGAHPWRDRREPYSQLLYKKETRRPTCLRKFNFKHKRRKKLFKHFMHFAFSTRFQAFPDVIFCETSWSGRKKNPVSLTPLSPFYPQHLRLSFTAAIENVRLYFYTVNVCDFLTHGITQKKVFLFVKVEKCGFLFIIHRESFDIFVKDSLFVPQKLYISGTWKWVNDFIDIYLFYYPAILLFSYHLVLKRGLGKCLMYCSVSTLYS